jgi:putative restriction endonuclease
LERYGLNGNVKCAFCDIANLNLIEAAHIIPYSNNPIYGLEVINNPKNGLCLCANHHKIFDLNQENPIVWINPKTLEIESKLEKLYLENELKITESSISNLNYLPDKGCLQWRFDKVPKT